MLDRFMTIKEFSLRPSSVKIYNWVIGKAKEKLGSRKICELRPFDIKEWFVQLAKQGTGKKTIKLLKTILCSACRFACEDDLVDKNIFDFRMSFINMEENKRVALTKAQERLVLDYLKQVSERAYWISIFFLETGVRLGEAFALTYDDIHLREGYIDINKQLIRPDGHCDMITDLKTKNAYRQIPITPKCKECIAHFLKHRDDTVIDGYTNFVITLSKTFYSRIVRQASLKTGIPVSPHVFRHTFCTNLANKGINLKALQYVMGHADSSITLDIYTSITPDDARKQMLAVL